MTAKSKIQILIDILMTVMLSACGKQSGEAYFAMKQAVEDGKIRSLGIVMQGWYPLGGRGYTAELLGNEVISKIAQAHGKSPAQVILRWNLQKGVVVISGSSSPEHINSSKMSGSGDGLAVWVEQSYNNTVVKLKTSGFPAALPLVGVHFL